MSSVSLPYLRQISLNALVFELLYPPMTIIRSTSIARFRFSTKEEEFFIFVELFSQGNIILCNSENRIRSALITKKWKDRTIRGNIDYVFPKQKYNTLTIKQDDFIVALKNTKKDSIVTTLAIDLGLGGRYAEELLIRGGIEKHRKRLNSEEQLILFKELSKIRKIKISARITKTEIMPIKLKLFSEAKECKSFNEALDKVLTGLIEKEEQTKETAGYDQEKKRIDKVIEQQTATIETLKQKAKDNQRKGELVFENYQIIDHVLKELNKAKKTHSWKEIKEKLKGHKVVKEIQEKNKKVTIEL